jgi:hypothetical protein
MAEMTPRELKLFVALKRIASYDRPEYLRRNSERDYGLPFEEALEYAYENIKQEAKDAIRGIRAPRKRVAAIATPTESAQREG